MRLKGKVALITGAGAGIGHATAVLFAREGAAVTVVDRSAETGYETVRTITQEGGRAIFVRADVSQSAEVREMFRATIESFGKLNILFNNAGTVAQGNVEETSEEEWETQIGTTLTSVYLGCKYGIPLLRQQGGGVIINMSSVAGVRGVKNRAVYSAAKGGVTALTKAIALDHAHEQIRAVYITPATIETPSLRERIRTASDPVAARKQFEARQPIGRLGQPEDVAFAALYLATDEAAFLTGCELAVDGGMGI